MFKDPVCNIVVDERTAKHVSDAQERGMKVYMSARKLASLSLRQSPGNTATAEIEASRVFSLF
jgi:hypothetical protein